MQSPLVITGMGMVSPLGCGVKAGWERLLAGRSGISSISRFDTGVLPIKVAGSVPGIADDTRAGFDPDRVADPKERRKMELFSLYAMAAAEEALTQANWFPESDAERLATATIVGSGIGGFPTITQAQNTLTTRGYRRLSPFTVPAFLANLAAGNVTIRYGFRGPLGCPVTACAAGVQAIGDGMRMIRSGEADVALVGGAEACIDPLSLASFHAMKALSTEQDAPARASRPFDQARNGFVMGEGAGLLVIETLAHAEARGATPLAVLSGYGTSADAYHITAGPEDGAGAAAAIRAALRMAGLAPEAIDHINAHATSTPVGDRAEIASLRNAFGDALAGIPISATKSATGHLLGAAGGVESIFSALAVMHERLPPTLNLEHADDDMQDLDFVSGTAREHRSQHVLCNGFGFGGVNAALIVSKM
ncbi:beta-ketoacyl-ACP synthase II [Halomonas urumqiensis]|uniref:3-oxoacyl-[acyl-carrier-protein] synthase 2 n=1 Tax=Halomonas urumqiensis TaxID=1684789 RepID=A0A2N7UQS0_9GAMM|nr:beta-ketoacyl-ACP synthase II [Halomonas urumqiensis]PMR82761.1 beta-ketoacyl-[acyl-carrier-protein] synthase II [Halomonas urumqiensis]PTB01920.1 beta-ketoacyl-[acyl-carrier-protein] synthase II [Halomonas urumqiensis]GHE22027.1 3-oxoacyl-[acyl-carrier-protein] synthase 2 [Halomonas urumqiensis]